MSRYIVVTLLLWRPIDLRVAFYGAQLAATAGAVERTWWTARLQSYDIRKI